MKKIVMFIIILLIMNVTVASSDSYNSYIEKELSEHSKLLKKLNLNEITFNKKFETIISKEQLKQINKTIILENVFQDESTEINKRIDELINSNKIKSKDISILINKIDNEIISIRNGQSSVNIKEIKLKEYKKLFEKIKKAKNIFRNALYDCKKCFNSKDTLQYLNINFKFISKNYVKDYMKNLRELENNLEKETKLCKYGENNDTKDIYCDIKTKGNELISYEKELKEIYDADPENVGEFRLLKNEREMLQKLKENLPKISDLYFTNLENVARKTTISNESIKEIKLFLENEHESIENFQRELSDFLIFLNTNITSEKGQILIEAKPNYEKSINRIVNQLDNSNEYKIKQIILMNAILNSFEFYQTNSELEKIYYEITNQIMIKYYKENKNSQIIQFNLISDLKSLEYNYKKMKNQLLTGKEEFLTKQEDLEFILNWYEIITQDLINELEKDESYNLTYFEGQEVDQIGFRYKNPNIKNILNLISEEIIKLKASEKIAFDETDDLSIYKIKNQALKDILIWLDVYRPEDRIKAIKTKNDNFLILNDKTRFLQKDLFNLNEEEIITISKEKLKLLSKIQIEINTFKSKDENYNVEDIENFMNIVDYYVFSKYIIESDNTAFWNKLKIDNEFQKKLNELTYNKIDKLKSTNQKNYLKNIYNGFIKNRLNPNIYFVKIIASNTKDGVVIKTKKETTKLSVKDIELLKYGVISIAKDYEIIKSNNIADYNSLAKYELINQEIKNKKGLFDRLTTTNNLDYYENYNDQIQSVSLRDFIFLINDKINIEFTNQIFNNVKLPYNSNSNTFEEHINNLVFFKIEEIKNVLNIYFDSRSSDEFNSNYLKLIKDQQVDPLINYLNDYEKYLISYKETKNKNSKIEFNDELIINEMNNQEILASLLKNRKNGYIYSQNEEKFILTKEIQKTIDNLVEINSNNNNGTEPILKLLESIKLDLLIEAHNYYFKKDYVTIKNQNKNTIKQLLNEFKDEEFSKTITKLEIITDKVIDKNYVDSVNELIAYKDLVKAQKIYFNRSDILEIIKDLDKYIINELKNTDISIEQINSEKYKQKIESKIKTETIYNPELKLNIGDKEIELFQIHQKISGTIDELYNNSDTEEKITELILISNIFETENKIDSGILKRLYNRIGTNKIINYYEILKFENQIELFGKDKISKIECVENINKIKTEFKDKSTIITSNNLDKLIDFIVSCEIYLEENENKEYDKKIIFSKLNKIRTNNEIFKNIISKNNNNNEINNLIDSLKESLDNIIVLKVFQYAHTNEKDNYLDEILIWLGIKKETINKANEENSDEIIQSLKKSLIESYKIKEFGFELNQTKNHNNLKEIMGQSNVLINKIFEVN